MNLCSFDIFDTALIRRFGRPEAIECLISGEHKQGDEKERAAEYANLVANPSILSLITEKRNSGCQIAFISDMYLDSKFLTEILEREGCYKPGDKVYISCEHDARKDTGTLYDLVRKELSPERWEHYGDNRRSDYAMAKSKGVDAKLVDSSFNAAENETQKQLGENNKAMTGLSRAARMKLGNNQYTALAADFVAPAYIPYVFQLKEWAKEQKIKHIYFLSRDSYILMKGFETAIKEDAEKPQVHYLFVSRRSLLLPYLHIAGGTELKKWYLSAMDHNSIKGNKVKSLLAALGTDKDELKRLSIEFQFEKVHTAEQEKEFIDKIFNGAYADLLKERAESAHKKLMKYFEQESLTCSQSSALVDVGWLGTSRRMINALLGKEQGAKTVYYYYGVRGDALPHSDGRYYAFYESNQLSTETTSLIENYYSSSPYETTIGYQENNEGKAEPKFPGKGSEKMKHIAEQNESVICWMTEVLKEWDMTNIQALREWATASMNVIKSLDVEIDLSPLADSDDFDTNSFMRKLKPNETRQIALFGNRVTAFDKASLYYTYGCGIKFKLLWTMHTASERIRRFLYETFIKKN